MAKAKQMIAGVALVLVAAPVRGALIKQRAPSGGAGPSALVRKLMGASAAHWPTPMLALVPTEGSLCFNGVPETGLPPPEAPVPPCGVKDWGRTDISSPGAAEYMGTLFLPNRRRRSSLWQ